MLFMCCRYIANVNVHTILKERTVTSVQTSIMIYHGPQPTRGTLENAEVCIVAVICDIPIDLDT